jgi:hypothetical protein
MRKTVLTALCLCFFASTTMLATAQATPAKDNGNRCFMDTSGIRLTMTYLKVDDKKISEVVSNFENKLESLGYEFKREQDVAYKLTGELLVAFGEFKQYGTVVNKAGKLMPYSTPKLVLAFDHFTLNQEVSIKRSRAGITATEVENAVAQLNIPSCNSL